MDAYDTEGISSLSHVSLPFHRPTVDLIGAMETQSEPSELELDDVVITNPHIEAILENEDWIEDASYVACSSELELRIAIKNKCS